MFWRSRSGGEGGGERAGKERAKVLKMELEMNKRSLGRGIPVMNPSTILEVIRRCLTAAKSTGQSSSSSSSDNILPAKTHRSILRASRMATREASTPDSLSKAMDTTESIALMSNTHQRLVATVGQLDTLTVSTLQRAKLSPILLLDRARCSIPRPAHSIMGPGVAIATVIGATQGDHHMQVASTPTHRPQSRMAEDSLPITTTPSPRTPRTENRVSGHIALSDPKIASACGARGLMLRRRLRRGRTTIIAAGRDMMSIVVRKARQERHRGLRDLRPSGILLRAGMLAMDTGRPRAGRAGIGYPLLRSVLAGVLEGTMADQVELFRSRRFSWLVIARCSCGS